MLKFLGWSDLLRLRRVSTATKRMTNLFIQVNTDKVPEIEINGKDFRTFAQFLKMGIPTKKLFLNNGSDPSFYEKVGTRKLRKFSKLYGSEVTSLRVSQLTIFPVKQERRLMKGFKNVQSFEAGRLVIGNDVDSELLEGMNILALLLNVPIANLHFNTLFPRFFAGLKNVSIGRDPENEEANELQLGYEVLKHCPNLKTASYPFDWSDLRSMETLRGTLTTELFNIQLYIEERENNQLPNLETFDFKNFGDNLDGFGVRADIAIAAYWAASQNVFLDLCLTAISTKTFFTNVRPHWFSAMNVGGELRLVRPDCGIPIVSLLGLHPCVMSLEMPNLEKITIPYSSKSVGIKEDEDTPDWPNLKCLELNVDGKVGHAWDYGAMMNLDPSVSFEVMSVRGLYRLFFKNVVRMNMTELDLNFLDSGWRDVVPVPKCGDIVVSCPNLKKIKLGNWKGTNKGLVTLWNGLASLEEVELEGCENLGNVAFVGEDVQEPVFLKLKSKCLFIEVYLIGFL